jgi:tRNA(Ile)-lysidine synthase
VPFGMKKKKKLSDFFTANKYSLLDKERQWLLCSGNEIVWVVGKRIDDRFKISNSTKSVLKIEINE